MSATTLDTKTRCRRALGEEGFELAIVEHADQRGIRAIHDLMSAKNRQRPRRAMTALSATVCNATVAGARAFTHLGVARGHQHEEWGEKVGIDGLVKVLPERNRLEGDRPHHFGDGLAKVPPERQLPEGGRR